MFESDDDGVIPWTALASSQSKNKCYKAQKVQKYALNSQLILTKDDEFENRRLSSFLLAV